jgi:AraC-like DNA-binding protein
MNKKILFTTDNLPANLDEGARRSLWHDLFVETVAPADIKFLSDQPMAVQFGFAQTGAVAIGEYGGTISSISNNPRLGKDPPQVFHLSFNSGASSFHYDIHKRANELAPGKLMLFAPDLPSTLRANTFNSWKGVQIPKEKLLERVPDAEDLVCLPLADTPAVRLFRRYVEMLSAEEGIADEPELADYVETTLLDLATLALGGNREISELSRMRGLPAARARSILAEIKQHFDDPAFSVSGVARKLALSPRYINELLQETGRGFAERVLELRLDKARRMLTASLHDRLRIIDIAHACGFGDISYFNRCFRRRFGASPMQYRGGGGELR